MLADKIKGLREKNLHTWMGGYARYLFDKHVASRRRPAPNGPRHLLFAVCDHYEPGWGNASREVGDARVRTWTEGYPAMAAPFRDADGHPPRHSFFFPGEQYVPEWLEALADLARGGYGEVELHLHHDGDTHDKLREDIKTYLDLLARHGHLSRDPDGRLRYGFIHGNWCLANARKDGRWCGVDDEIRSCSRRAATRTTRSPRRRTIETNTSPNLRARENSAPGA